MLSFFQPLLNCLNCLNCGCIFSKILKLYRRQSLNLAVATREIMRRVLQKILAALRSVHVEKIDRVKILGINPSFDFLLERSRQ